jgi:hypothetical protein
MAKSLPSPQPLKNKFDLIREIVQCGKDPLYFINNYARIQHPVRGLIPFRVFPYQEDTVKAFLDHRLNIILKGRQLGFTTIVAAFIAWFIIFQKDKNVLIVSTKSEVAKTTIRIIRNIMKFIPPDMMICRITTDNKQSIELSNGSRVTAISTSADAGRSEAVSLLFVDEVAHIDKMDDLWTGIWPTISAGGRAILSSTPNGTANFFYRTYKQAAAYESSFNCRYGTYTNPENPTETYNDRFPWWVHPEHDKAWFDDETAGKSARDVAQEYECNFNSSGDTFLPGAQIQVMQFNVREPEIRMYDDRNLWVWKQPSKHGIYIISCDVASGFAEDYSAFHVIRIDSRLEQAAEYKGKIPADNLGELLMRTSITYNNATIAVEQNSGWAGQAVQRITDANYKYLYWSPRQNVFVDTYHTTLQESMPGYRITSSNRIAMLSKMEQYIRKGDIQLYSQRLVDEFQQFIWLNGKPMAARMAHDDLIMALAGGLWIREESFASKCRNVDLTMAMIESMSAESTPVSQMRHFNQSKDDPYRNQHKLVLENGATIDITQMLLMG